MQAVQSPRTDDTRPQSRSIKNVLMSDNFVYRVLRVCPDCSSRNPHGMLRPGPQEDKLHTSFALLEVARPFRAITSIA